MTFETLALYCDVVRLGSFSLGAANRRITQPAVSLAVREIERQLGARLIDRSKRPFMVTAEGKKFFEVCLSILEQFEKVKAEILEKSDVVGGTVRVAVIYSVGLQDMGFYTQQFNAKYPEAKIRLAFLHPNEVIDAVVQDDADLGILSFPTQHRSLAIVPWHDEPMVFVCHRTHPLARKRVVAPKEIARERFIAFEKNLAIRKAIDRALRQRGAAANVVMEFDNIETIKQAISMQSGVSILPTPSVSREVENGMVTAVPIDMPELVRPIGIVHRRRKQLSPIASKLLQFLKTVER